jgi:hypothetical protein
VAFTNGLLQEVGAMHLASDDKSQTIAKEKVTNNTQIYKNLI